MKRILFVDDEVLVLEGLKNRLRKVRHEWDMQFAVGAIAALEQMAQLPFDVVVSDMRMPGMDGVALLGEVKAHYPGTARIVLSGYCERDMILRALPVSQQYLSKPCDAELLRSVIDRTWQLHGLLVDPKLRDMIGKLESVPSIPETYWELTGLLSDADVNMDRIVAVIERDPALSSKVLQLANSAYFGRAQRVGTVARAVGYLGIELIRSLALTTKVFSVAEQTPVPGFSIHELFEKSLAVASIARQIMPDPNRVGDAYTAGVLHDIGKLILAMGEPQRFAQALGVAAQSGRPMCVVEKEILGVSHAEVGAYLLGTWGLPIETVAAVAYHHSLTEAADVGDLIVAVHVASALVDEALTPSIGSSGPGHQLDTRALEALGLSARIKDWIALADQTLNQKDGGNARGPGKP